MTFPVRFDIFGMPVPAHAVFEILAYTLGFHLYLLLRRRWQPAAPVPLEQSLWIIVGCVFGALVGSRLLAWIELMPEFLRQHNDALGIVGGKTIVGGLLGGWAGVEIAKKRLGITRSTGDGFVFPLIIGIAIGRIGCFLAGLTDHTHGSPTTLPWAVDLGDGVGRHPAQLYEIAFLLLLGTALLARTRRPWREGELFRLFMLGYFSFRLATEFIKPVDRVWLGLSAIQVACLLGAIVSARGIIALRRDRPTAAAALAQIRGEAG